MSLNLIALRHCAEREYTMVYESRLIAVVKHNNNILREVDGIVYLPFGSEYSILFKNKHVRNCSVSVNIDGKDVLSGINIVIKPDTEPELLGFINNSGIITNRFKFIQKTKEIAEYRGDRIDDGIITINFRFEKEIVHPIIYRELSMNPRAILGASGPLKASSNVTFDSFSNDIRQDEGITVHGTKIDKATNSISLGPLESEIHNIIIRLKGQDIKSPIFNNTKIVCPTCGRKNKSSFKFCGNCGTSLI